MIKKTLTLTIFLFSLTFTNQAFAGTSTSKIKKRSKTQRSLSQDKRSSRITKRAFAHKSLIKNYKRLSAKQKIRLITSMVRTMAALELAHSRRRGRAPTSYHDSLFRPLWSLFIMRAYADLAGDPPGGDPLGDTCFFGGHLVPTDQSGGGCNWDAARDDHLGCDWKPGSRNGVRCNPDLFPSKPCVPDFREGQGIARNYSSTQACAYADAHNIQKHIEQGGEDLTDIPVDPNIVEDQLTNSGFGLQQIQMSGFRKRDEILGDHEGKYIELLAGHNDRKIIENLQEIQRRCNHSVPNSFEEKHCDAFKKDLDVLLHSAPTPTPPDPDPIDPAEDDPDCFDFHKLPGEHFCQVRVATNDKKKDHLIVRLEGTINGDGSFIGPPHREAVAYRLRLDNDKKQYCKDSSFVSKSYSRNRMTQSKSDTCNNNISHKVEFSHLGVNFYTNKENGNNMCKFTAKSSDQEIPNEHYAQQLLSSDDKLSNFLPGVRVQCPYINIDDGVAPRVSDTHINCEGLRRNLNGTDSNKCVDPDVVALRNAINSLKHLDQCSRGQTLTIKIKKGNGEYQSLDDWLKDHQSLGDGEYEIQVERRKHGSNNRWPGHYEFNSHLGDTDGTFPHGRKHRTISDWLYGDGKSVEDASENGGLNGIASRLCHKPQRRVSPSSRGTDKGIL